MIRAEPSIGVWDEPLDVALGDLTRELANGCVGPAEVFISLPQLGVLIEMTREPDARSGAYAGRMRVRAASVALVVLLLAGCQATGGTRSHRRPPASFLGAGQLRPAQRQSGTGHARSIGDVFNATRAGRPCHSAARPM